MILQNVCSMLCAEACSSKVLLDESSLWKSKTTQARHNVPFLVTACNIHTSQWGTREWTTRPLTTCAHWGLRHNRHSVHENQIQGKYNLPSAGVSVLQWQETNVDSLPFYFNCTELICLLSDPALMSSWLVTLTLPPGHFMVIYGCHFGYCEIRPWNKILPSWCFELIRTDKMAKSTIWQNLTASGTGITRLYLNAIPSCAPPNSSLRSCDCK